MQKFIKSESGAITVDMVVLTCGIVGLGLATAAAVIPAFNTGNNHISNMIRGTIGEVFYGGELVNTDLGGVTIPSAFEITATARFDDVNSGWYQRVFDFGDGQATNNIFLSSIQDTNHMYALMYDVGGQEWVSITAPNSIVEGEEAEWGVSLTEDGTFSLTKNDVLLASRNVGGPLDDDRAVSGALVGQSHWSWDTDTVGSVTDLTITDLSR